jgi:hypothetical protein
MKSLYSVILLALVGVGLWFSVWVARGPVLDKIEGGLESVVQANTSPVVLIGLNALEKSHLEFVKQWIDLAKSEGKPVQSIIAQISVSSQLSNLGQVDSFEPERDNHGVYAALKKSFSGQAGAVLVLTDQVQALSVAQSSLASLLLKEDDQKVMRLILVTPEPIKESALQRVTCPDQKLTECMTKRSQLLAQLRSKDQPKNPVLWQWSDVEKVVVLGRF